MVNSSDEVSKKLTAIESKLNTIKENSSNKIELSVVIKKDSFRTGNGTGQFFKISPMNAKSSPLRSTVESVNKNDIYIKCQVMLTQWALILEKKLLQR